MLPALSCLQSSPSINLCTDDAGLKHDNQDNGDDRPDEDMAVELLSDSEYNSSLHDSSFMSVIYWNSDIVLWIFSLNYSCLYSYFYN